jgi:hypothetical protein
MPKKGGAYLETFVAAASGAYVAKQANSPFGLLKMVIAIVVVSFVLWYILGFILRALNVEYFSVPLKPSEEGDKKLVTPAGNVIIY